MCHPRFYSCTSLPAPRRPRVDRATSSRCVVALAVRHFMSGPRAWLAQHANRRSDPNKWVFFGMAWATAVGGFALTFQVLAMLYPPQVKPPVMEESQLVVVAKR